MTAWTIMRVGALLLWAFQGAHAAYTFEQSYLKAKARNESVLIQAEVVQKSEERYRQMRGSVLPEVTGSLTYFWQDDQARGAHQSSGDPSHQRTAKVSVVQPLFRGLREFRSLKQARLTANAQKSLKLDTELRLFQQLSENFHSILAMEQDLANLNLQIKAYEDRIKELGRYLKLGRSKKSDLLTAQTQQALLRVEREEKKSAVLPLRETYQVLTGLASESALVGGDDPNPAILKPLPYYLERLNLRPDIRAYQELGEASEQAVAVARGAHLPSADLTFNRYLHRDGGLKEVDWDTQISITVPIFSGGTTQSQFREAVSEKTKTSLQLKQLEKAAEQEVRSAYQLVVSGFSQLEYLRAAVRSSRDALRQQQRDYRFGVVTNLDVLGALAAQMNAQRTYDHARYQLQIQWAKLQAASNLIN